MDKIHEKEEEKGRKSFPEIVVARSMPPELRRQVLRRQSEPIESRAPENPSSPVLSIQRTTLNLAQYNSRVDPRLTKNNSLWVTQSGKNINQSAASVNSLKNNFKSVESVASSTGDYYEQQSATGSAPTNGVNGASSGELGSGDYDDDDDEVGCWAGFWRRRRCTMSSECWVRKMEQFLPITSWLRHYNVQQNLIADILVGITVAIFQVPQSMGYCLIANVPPVHGLYTAFFPPLVYAIFGTSHHSSVGAFALVSGVMTGHLVQQLVDEEKYALEHRGEAVPPVGDVYWDELHVNTATAASLSMGIMMTLFGLLRLGFVSIYLSPQSIGGFCCAASIYVFTSQLGHLTGYHHELRSGWFAMPLAVYDLFADFSKIHTLTAVISIVTITLLAVFKLYLNPWFMRFQKNLSDKRLERKRASERRQIPNYGSSNSVVSSSLRNKAENKNQGWNPLPFPIELLVVIVMTVVSGMLSLEKNQGVEIVGEIKQGMPSAVLPPMSMVARVFFRSIPLSVVGYAITLSIGRLFGGKHGYTVDPDQELIAVGLSNLLGSSFGCLPSAASLPRSAIQENTGGKTQLVSIVNCAALFVVILQMGPLLEPLPNCILASIISVALLGLISQMKDVKSLWRVSPIDGLQWLVSFFAVVVCDVDVGLYVGTGFSLLVLIYNSSRPKTYILGSCDSTAEDVYVPTKFYRRSAGKEGVSERPGIKVYQFCGPLHFSSKDFFKRDLLKQCALKRKNTNSIHHVIIDCSMLSYVDTTGLAAVKSVVQEELGGRGITTFLACCAPHVVEMMSKDEAFFKIIPPYHVFVSVHDAVLHAVDQCVPLRIKNSNLVPASSRDSGIGPKTQLQSAIARSSVPMDEDEQSSHSRPS